MRARSFAILMAAFVGTFALFATPAEAGGRRYYKNHYGYHHGGGYGYYRPYYRGYGSYRSYYRPYYRGYGYYRPYMVAMGIVSRTTVAMGVRPFTPYHRFRSPSAAATGKPTAGRGGPYSPETSSNDEVAHLKIAERGCPPESHDSGFFGKLFIEGSALSEAATLNEMHICALEVCWRQSQPS